MFEWALDMIGNLTATNRIARWDGVAWSPLASGLSASVETLLVFDDGIGAMLYAGGAFTTAGGVPAEGGARWDGAAWGPVGEGLNATVRVLTVFDDGTGAALYAGGDFTASGTAGLNRVAKWDGAAWLPLGLGTNGTVRALAAFYDLDGPALYVGGDFTYAGGLPSARIARWGCPPPLPCYANCDNSTTQPILNVDDLVCFINEFAAAQHLPHEQQTSIRKSCGLPGKGRVHQGGSRSRS